MQNSSNLPECYRLALQYTRDPNLQLTLIYTPGTVCELNSLVVMPCCRVVYDAYRQN